MKGTSHETSNFIFQVRILVGRYIDFMNLNIGRKNNLEIRITDSGCWECLNIKPFQDGRYYQFMTGSRKDNSRRNVLLHRYIYEYFVEKIPQGLVVRHSCDNNLCINYNHLSLGTHQDNSNDMISRGRSATGERNSSCKIKNEQVSKIIELYNSGDYTQKELGIMFGVSQKQISNIVRGLSRISNIAVNK